MKCIITIIAASVWCDACMSPVYFLDTTQAAFPTMQHCVLQNTLLQFKIKKVFTSNSSAILGPSRNSLVLRQSTGPKLAVKTHF